MIRSTGELDAGMDNVHTHTHTQKVNIECKVNVFKLTVVQGLDDDACDWANPYAGPRSNSDAVISEYFQTLESLKQTSGVHDHFPS